MSDTQKHKKPNVPNLRFPEFSGEWERKRFGECCEGFDYGMNAASKPYDGVNGYIRITDIDEDTSTFKKEGIVSPDAEIDENYRVAENNILFARTGASTGKTYLYKPEDGKLYFAGFLIRAKVSSEYDSRFLFYQTQTKQYKKWVQIMSMRSGQPGINSQEYASFSLNIPQISEQNRIASLLELIDQRIVTQNKVIEKYESLIKALYESLIPCEGVDSVQLGSLVQICKGKQLNAELLSETGLYYVMNGGIFPSGYYDTYNTPQDIISISEGGNSCGYVQFNHKPFWSGGHCYTLLNPNENKVHYKYLFHFLKCHQDDIMALRIGSGLPNIQKKDIEKYPIALPNYETQVQLASLFDTINCKKENGIESLRQYKIMKSFLLSELFI